MLKNKGYTRRVLQVVALLLAVALLGVATVSCSLQEEQASSITLPVVEVQQEPESKPEPEKPQLSFTEEEIAHLNAMLDAWAATSEENEEDGHNVSVYFKDIDSGLTYTYNAERTYFVASLNKAPYGMYLYHLVEIGQASLDETFYVTNEMVNRVLENSGKIKEMDDLPKNLTLQELLMYLLRYSDTAALKILMTRYGAEGYKEYMEAQQVPTENMRNISNGRITAAEAGATLDAMYDFMQTPVYGEMLRQDLANTNYRMIRTENPYAGKYGWDENAYHDMAVVYAPHPYTLAILTDKDEGTWAETNMFSKIATALEEIMEVKWAQVQS